MGRGDLSSEPLKRFLVGGQSGREQKGASRHNGAAGTETAGANPDPLALAVDHHASDLKVRQKTPIGLVVRMAHVVPVNGLFTADLATFRHWSSPRNICKPGEGSNLRGKVKGTPAPGRRRPLGICHGKSAVPPSAGFSLHPRAAFLRLPRAEVPVRWPRASVKDPSGSPAG